MYVGPEMSMLNQALVASTLLMLQIFNELNWYVYFVGFTSVWFQSSIDFCLKYENNLKPLTCRPTSDSRFI